MKDRLDEPFGELGKREAREPYGIQRLKARSREKKRAGAGLKRGIREEKKAAKLRQIKSAATKLFLSKGYEKTTLREIAQQADVGLGTIFFYVEDKREILLMVFSDVLKRAIRRGLDLARPELPLICLCPLKLSRYCCVSGRVRHGSKAIFGRGLPEDFAAG